MNRFLLVLLAALAVSTVAWLSIDRTHGLFEATDVIAEGREKGGFDQDMFDRYKSGEMGSAAASLAIWGALVAGLCGALFREEKSSKFWLGMIAGVVLGALTGALSGYLSYWHSTRFEFRSGAIGYWSVRTSLILAPMAVAAALVSAKSVHLIVDCLVSSLLAGVLTTAVYVGSMGAWTPNEDHAQLFPASAANRCLLIFCFNTTVVLAISQALRRSRILRDKHKMIEESADQGLS